MRSQYIKLNEKTRSHYWGTINTHQSSYLFKPEEEVISRDICIVSKAKPTKETLPTEQTSSAKMMLDGPQSCTDYEPIPVALETELCISVLESKCTNHHHHHTINTSQSHTHEAQAYNIHINKWDVRDIYTFILTPQPKMGTSKHPRKSR